MAEQGACSRPPSSLDGARAVRYNEVSPIVENQAKESEVSAPWPG
nr:MAG TPA: hypothetical protein [Caudoviricetes sp.]